MQKKKIMYLVKREVLAYSMKEAIISRGKVYEITEAGPEYQPEIKKIPIGFRLKKNEGRNNKLGKKSL